MRFLVRNAGFVNKGAEAMLKTVKDQLSRRIPNSQFALERGDIGGGLESMAEAAGFEIVDRHVGHVSSKVDLAIQMVFAPREVAQIYRERSGKYGVKQLVRQFDAVIDISGYAYGGHWSPKIASRTLAIAEKAKRRGIPYIFLPQAWGPFSNMSAHRSLYRRMCEQGTLLYARDKVSQEELAQLLGKDPSQISRSPDIAFLFQHSGVRKGEALLRQLGLSMDKLIVCISPNCKVYDRFDGFGMQNRYLQSLGSVITCLLGAGVDIVLLPHEIRLSSREIDDRILCEFLRLQTGEPDRVVAVTSMTSSEDLKALIACCDLVIGSRFHVLVGGLSSLVPVVAIGWSHKYKELLRDVGLDDWVIDYEQLTNTQLIGKVETAWDQRNLNKQKLSEKVPKIVETARDMFDDLCEVINQPCTIN